MRINIYAPLIINFIFIVIAVILRNKKIRIVVYFLILLFGLYITNYTSETLVDVIYIGHIYDSENRLLSFLRDFRVTFRSIEISLISLTILGILEIFWFKRKANNVINQK